MTHKQLDLETLRYVKAVYELREVGVDFEDWLSEATFSLANVEFKSCGCPREIDNYMTTDTTVPTMWCVGCGLKVN